MISRDHKAKMYEVGACNRHGRLVVLVVEGEEKEFGPVIPEVIGRHIQYWMERGEPGWVEEEDDASTEEQGEPG
jgi:hypothetical protein